MDGSHFSHRSHQSTYPSLQSSILPILGDDDASILTPSTVSSDDIDLGFSSDDECSGRGVRGLDFSSLPQRHQQHDIKESIRYPLDSQNVNTTNEGLLLTMDPSTQNGGVRYPEHRDERKEDECDAIESFDSETDGSDDDEESIGWAPTPVKASELHSLGGSLENPTGLFCASDDDEGVTKGVNQNLFGHSSRNPSYNSRDFEEVKQRFYEGTRNSSPRGSPQAVPRSFSMDQSVDSSTSCSEGGDSSDCHHADNEAGARSTRRPPPPTSTPPAAVGQEPLRAALSSIGGVQGCEEEEAYSSDESELVDQLSQYDVDAQVYDDEGTDSDSDDSVDEDERCFENQDCRRGIPSPYRPQLRQSQPREPPPQLRESIFILEELQGLDSSFGRGPPLPPPPPPRQQEADPPKVTKDTFPLFASGPRRLYDTTEAQEKHMKGISREHGQEHVEDHIPLSDSGSLCSSDREFSRLVNLLPVDRDEVTESLDMAAGIHSTLDEEDPLSEDNYDAEVKVSQHHQREREQQDLEQELARRKKSFGEEQEGESEEKEHENMQQQQQQQQQQHQQQQQQEQEQSIFAESSALDLFNYSLNRQQAVQTSELQHTQQSGPVLMSTPVRREFSPLSSSYKSRNATKTILAQKSRKDAIAAFRQSDENSKGVLVFSDFCRFLEISGFFPLPLTMQTAVRTPFIADDPSYFRRGVKPSIPNSVHMKTPAVTVAEKQKQLGIKKKAFLLAHSCGSRDEMLSPGCASSPIGDLKYKDLVYLEKVESVSLNDVIRFLDVISSNTQFRDKTIARIVTELRNRRRMYKKRITSSSGKARATSSPSKIENRHDKISTTGSSHQRGAQTDNSCSTFFPKRGAEYGLSSEEAREVYRERRWNKVLQETTHEREKDLTFHPKLTSKPPPPPTPLMPSTSEFTLSELDTSLPPPELQLSRNRSLSSSKSLAYTNRSQFDKDEFNRLKKKSTKDLEVEEHCTFHPQINGESPFISERTLATITKHANASAPPPPPPPRSGLVNCGQSLQEAKENEIMTIPLDTSLNIYYYNTKACPPTALPVVIPDAPPLPGSAWVNLATEKKEEKSKFNFVIMKKSAAEREALAKSKPAFGSLLEELNFKLKGIGTEDSKIKLKPAPKSSKLKMGGKNKKKKQKEGFENLMDEMKFMLARLNKDKDGEETSSSDESEEEEEEEVAPSSEKVPGSLDGIQEGNLNLKLMAMLSKKDEPLTANEEENKRNPSELRRAVENNRFNIPTAPPLPGMPQWSDPISYQEPSDDFSSNEPPPLHISQEESSDSRPAGYYLPSPAHLEIEAGQILLAAHVGEHEGIDYLVQVRLFREQEQDFRARRRVSLASQVVKTVAEVKGRGGLRTGDVLITPGDIEKVKEHDFADDEMTVISYNLKNRKTPQDLPIPSNFYKDVKRLRGNMKLREDRYQQEWNKGMRNYNEKEVKSKNNCYLDSVTKQTPFKFSTTARKKNKVISFRPRSQPASKTLAITEFVAAHSGFLNQSNLDGDLGAKLWSSNLRNHSSRQKGLTDKATHVYVSAPSSGRPSLAIATDSEEEAAELELTKGGLPRSYPEFPRGKAEAPTLHYFSRSEKKAVRQMRKKEEEDKAKKAQEEKAKDKKRLLREKAKAVMQAVQRSNSVHSDKGGFGTQAPPATSFARSLSKLAPWSSECGPDSVQYQRELDSCVPTDAESVNSRYTVTSSQLHENVQDYMSDDECKHTNNAASGIYDSLNVDVDLSSYYDEDESVLDEYYDADTISIQSMHSDDHCLRTPNSEVMSRKAHTPLKMREQRRQNAKEAISASALAPDPTPSRQAIGFRRQLSAGKRLDTSNKHQTDAQEWVDTRVPPPEIGQAPEFRDSRVKYRELAALRGREEVIQQRIARARVQKTKQSRDQRSELGEECQYNSFHSVPQDQPPPPPVSDTYDFAEYANNPDLEAAQRNAGIVKKKTTLKMFFGELEEVTSEEDKGPHQEDTNISPPHVAALDTPVEGVCTGHPADDVPSQDRFSGRDVRDVPQAKEQEREQRDEVPTPELADIKTPVRRASTLFAKIEFASERALLRTASLENPSPRRATEPFLTTPSLLSAPVSVAHAENEPPQSSNIPDSKLLSSGHYGNDHNSETGPEPASGVLDTVRRLSGAASNYGYAPAMDVQEAMRQVSEVRRSLKVTEYPRDPSSGTPGLDVGLPSSSPSWQQGEEQLQQPAVLSPAPQRLQSAMLKHETRGDESDQSSLSTLQKIFSCGQDDGPVAQQRDGSESSGEGKEIETDEVSCSDRSQRSYLNDQPLHEQFPDPLTVENEDSSFYFQENSCGREASPLTPSSHPIATRKDSVATAAGVLSPVPSLRTDTGETALGGKHVPHLSGQYIPRRSTPEWDSASLHSDSSSRYEQILDSHKKKMNHVERQSMYMSKASAETIFNPRHDLHTQSTSSLDNPHGLQEVEAHTSQNITPPRRKMNQVQERKYEDLLQGHKKKMNHVERQSLYVLSEGQGASRQTGANQLLSTAEEDEEEHEDKEDTSVCSSVGSMAQSWY